MYTYFLLKTLYPTIEIRSAKYLTSAQIGQFFTGIFCSAGVLYMGERCDSQSSRFSLLCLHVYGFGLIALFVAFAKRKYSKVSSD
jgi:GNS1/SUR4 family